MLKSKFIVIGGFLILLSIIISPGADASRQADLVVHNGTIYTVNPGQPVAEMVAVIDGKIIFVGQNDALGKWVGPQTKVIDLQGKTMTPGFIESHGHLIYLGYAKMRLDLSTAVTYEELVKRVAKAAQDTPHGEWIIGRGWHQSKWDPAPDTMVNGFQTHQALSRMTPDHPVFLSHASGHAGFANARAMEICGITRLTEFSGGGEIIKDADGNPTGIFTENAQGLIREHIPDSTPQKNRRALKLGIEAGIANGLTGFRDAGSGRDAIALYREFLRAGELKIRLWVMLDGSDESLLQEWFAKGPEVGSGNHFLTVRAVKLFADGALGSRGAWLLKPYTDRPQHSGHAVMPMEEIYQTGLLAQKHGFQLCVHAIGDRANHEVLDQFERVFNQNADGTSDDRFRIEHAQHLNAGDIPRFAELGVIASMQGIHMSSDRPWAIDRLGQERIVEGAYMWQKLLQSGAVVVNGTDAPVEPVSPIASFFASVTRKTLKGQPPGGFEPAQKMTRRQALRSYTLDAAYAGFEENVKGSIEVGKFADFTVFSQDIMTVPEDQILNTKVVYTMIGGKIEYRLK